MPYSNRRFSAPRYGAPPLANQAGSNRRIFIFLRREKPLRARSGRGGSAVLALDVGEDHIGSRK